MEELTRLDANKFRDTLLERMKPNSVVRVMNVVSAALTFVITEDDLKFRNVFQKMVIKGGGGF